MNGREFRERLFIAVSIWQVKNKRRLTQTELGEMVGKLRKGEPVPQTTISDYFNRIVPGLEDTYYLARALGVDPGWLGFGGASLAPGPHDPLIDAQMPIPEPRKALEGKKGK